MISSYVIWEEQKWKLKGTMVGNVPIHDNPRHINTIEKADELVATLGDGKAVLLRGHGVTVVGKTVEEVFFLSVCLEENATYL
jgi:ribulose-5-phosphate 4-epimerase/fuculose-1-phosphate aldolase